MRIVLSGVFIFLMGLGLLAQPGNQLSTKSKKAKKYYEKAVLNFDQRDDELAMMNIDLAIQTDSNFVEAWLVKAQISENAKNYEDARYATIKAIEIRPMFFLPAYFNIGRFSLKLSDYAMALEYFEKYLDLGSIPPKQKAFSEQAVKNCRFALEEMKDPKPFKLKNLGMKVNTKYTEFVNCITIDGNRLIYTALLPKRGRLEEDFYTSKKQPNGKWGLGVPLPGPFNTNENEGAMNFSPDGSFLVYTMCQRKQDSYGGCDIYYSEYKGDKWSQPRNIGAQINSRNWDSHACIASDGKTLYFVSNRPGGYGGSDIYKSVRQADGSWSKAENLGPNVNSSRNEMYPFAHPDNQTLYFSSEGHLGFGGLDFFLSRKTSDGKWGQAENLGYPINTNDDEQGLIVAADGELAYVSTNKDGGFGEYDIYSFNLWPEAQPTPVTYLKGNVYDAKDKSRLRAHFELIDLGTGEVVVESNSNTKTGEFLVCIPTNREYALNVSRNGYLFYSDNFSLEGNNNRLKPFLKDVPMKPIVTGETVVLNNIFFDTDKFDLKTKSHIELNKLVDLLKLNPNLRIEISGHTDDRGDAAHNQRLSENRAKAVYNYLIVNGIQSNRLQFAGYGESKPIADNTTEEGRAMNRRTEFKVIAI